MRDNDNPVYGSGTAVAADFNGAAFEHKGGRIVLGGYGTFGSGTLAVQYTPDADVTFTDLGQQNAVATSLTAAGSVTFFLPRGRYRVRFSGSTAPTLAWFCGAAE